MIGRYAVLLSGWMLASAVSASAQTAVPSPSAVRTQRLEASIGYQLLHIPGETYPFGLNFDVSGRVHPLVDVVGEFGFARDERTDPLVNRTLTFLNFGAGPRWTWRAESFEPFAQLLVGAASPGATLTTATGQVGDRDWAFMVQPGAGIVVPVAHAFGVVGQVDYRRVFFKETGENEVRFFAGLRVGLR